MIWRDFQWLILTDRIRRDDGDDDRRDGGVRDRGAVLMK